MADQALYWESRGVPRLPDKVLKLDKGQRKAWRIRYVQDLYIPDGLNGREENKWRARNTVHVLTGTEQRATTVPLRSFPSRPRPDINAKDAKTSQKVAPKAPAKCAPTGLHFGITRLCIPPQKVWHHADGSMWQLDVQDTNAVKGTSDDVQQIDQVTERSLSPHVSKMEQSNISQDSPRKRQKVRHVIYPPVTERRLSSIANNLGGSTGEETFKRITAIFDRDSESDSEASDFFSEVETTDRPVMRGSVAESFAEQINQGSPTIHKASPNSQLYVTLQEAAATSEAPLSDGHEGWTLPRDNDDRGLEATSPALPATMVAGQKLPCVVDSIGEITPVSSDNGSASSVQAGNELHTSSRPPRAVNARTDARDFNLDAEESTQEVYEAVEEVLEDVCSSTRALPSSRSTRSRMRKDPLITKPSSPYSELVPEPVILQQSKATLPHEDVDSDNEESMAEVGEEAGEVDMDGISTSSTSCAGSNIVVTYKSASGSQADVQEEGIQAVQPGLRPSIKSSSSLSEALSRSPIPLPSTVKSQVSTLSTFNTKKSKPLPASARVVVTRTSAFKRKMTGVTSKHFSNLDFDKGAASVLRQSRRNAAKTASNVESEEKLPKPLSVEIPSTTADDGSEEDVIVVASRRRVPQPEPARHGAHDVKKTVSHLTRSILLPKSPPPKRIAFVDLTGLPSKKLIAYVDLTGVPTSQLKQDFLKSSSLNDDNEPLDHLEKLLKSPHRVEQTTLSPSIDLTGDEAWVTVPTTPKRTAKKTTGTKSPHFITDRVDQYNTTSSSRRVPAGTSTVPFPAVADTTFGIIQEKLWQEPFWLLIAVTFLNKTTGRAAVPVFWKVKKLFPSPAELAKADPEVLLDMVKTLGLQNARSKRLVVMAEAWVASPPVKGKSFRTLNYPSRGDGRASQVPELIEVDSVICKGSLEIGQIPGCGAYAYDSWRIFCRDVLRGVAKDYNGKGAGGEGFEAEWKRVLPEDKELRACLRWMWLREGWVWDPLTGKKRPAEQGKDPDAFALPQMMR